jgi:hypothetical protein
MISMVLFQEIHDYSLAYVVIAYGMAVMNQHEKRGVGDNKGPGTFFTPCKSDMISYLAVWTFSEYVYLKINWFSEERCAFEYF